MAGRVRPARMTPDPKETERVSIPLDPEEALRALLQVDPDAPAADEADAEAKREKAAKRSG